MVTPVSREGFGRRHVMDLPGKVVVGEDVLSDAAKYLGEVNDELGGVYIVTGPNLAKSLLYSLVSNLELPYHTFVVEKASMEEMEKVKRVFNKVHSEKGFEVVIGFGGGKSIDMAKMLAYQNSLDFVSIPTAPSHDGIASQFASLKGAKKTFSLKTLPPKLVLVDLGIILSSPPRLIASGFGDVLAKFTAVADWRLARDDVGEYYGEYAASLALMSAELVLKNYRGIAEHDGESIRTLVEALISTGVAAGIAGSSRPCSGSEHLFSHALDLYFPNKAFHGEKVGLGTIMMAYLHGLDWEGIREAIAAVGGPTNYREAGLTRDMIIDALVLAKDIRPERYTILHKLKLNKEAAENLAVKTKVI